MTKDFMKVDAKTPLRDVFQTMQEKKLMFYRFLKTKK